jgi:hypothetical protein
VEDRILVSRWLAITGYGVGGVIVGAVAGWGVGQLLTDPAAGVAAFEVGAVLGGVLGAVWRAGASR